MSDNGYSDPALEFYKSIFESSLDAILLTRPDGTIFYANSSAQKLYGYSQKELCDLGRSGIVDTNDPNLQVILDERARLGKSKGELTLIRKDGSKFPADVSTNIFKDKNGNLNTFMTIHDITHRKKAEKKLAKQAIMLANINDAVIGTDENYIINYWNNSAEKMYGYSKEEIIGQYSIILKPKFLTITNDEALKQLETSGTLNVELIHTTKDGRKIIVDSRNQTLFDEMGNRYGMIGINRDITERKKIEEKLKLAGLYNRSLIEASLDPLVTIGPDGKVMDVNMATETVTGSSRDEIIGSNFSDYFTEPEKAKKGYKKVFKEGFVKDYPLEIQHKNGHVIPVLYNASVYRDDSGNVVGVFAAARDITKQKKAQEQIKKSLSEKNMLLKEIHHRVKNNLMIISSLLNLESRYIKDKASKDIFKESQNRARSMALIHERLYQSTDLKRIDFGEYITSLSNELFHTYAADSGVIKLKINAENIFLDINTAIPLGLIANELVTNSLKYAFPENMGGKISIDFHPLDDLYEFTVNDNGIGFPEELDYKNTESLGLQLVTNLAEQIDGEIELDELRELNLRSNSKK